MKLKFIKTGRKGVEEVIEVDGEKEKAFQLEKAMKQGWHYEEEDV